MLRSRKDARCRVQLLDDVKLWRSDSDQRSLSRLQTTYNLNKRLRRTGGNEVARSRGSNRQSARPKDMSSPFIMQACMCTPRHASRYTRRDCFVPWRPIMEGMEATSNLIRSTFCSRLDLYRDLYPTIDLPARQLATLFRHLERSHRHCTIHGRRRAKKK
jgi:hypothetical protein